MSKKEEPISPEEAAEFRDAMKAVSPLKNPSQKHQSSPPSHPPLRDKTGPRSREYQRIPPPSTFHLDYCDTRDWLSAEDTLHFAHPGLQHKLIQRMKRGQINLQASIDLHQQTTEEAMDSLSPFIEQCVANGMRWIGVIHGKGYCSKEGKPILKNFLNQWLRAHPLVLAFHSAKPKQGGTGAVYVLLRKTRR